MHHLKYILLFPLVALLTVLSAAPNPADHWVATDALGRELVTYEDAGDARPDKLVGMFYYIWVGNHTQKVYNITEILKQPEGEREWGNPQDFHFWDEPEYGYYHASDPWVIRHDMQMLANSGVDFIFFDVTNALIYLDSVLAVCEVIEQMHSEGIAAPEVSFLTNTRSGETMNKVYDEFYSKGLYKDIWFGWEGKPFILGHPDDAELRPEVKDFFTIKYSWAWTDADKEPDHWQWLDKYPQDYAWSESPDVPVQVPVSTAHHPQNPLGKSFHDGAQPEVDEDYLTEFTDEGLQFAEQWKRAHELDPQVVMVTQWNEWLAQRFIWNSDRGDYAGRPIKKGDTFFVDVLTKEFNRDIAPMKGGYTDNYYYQLVDNVRRFKGMEKPLARAAQTEITIDGSFSDWEAVETEYLDSKGDTSHRNYRGTEPDTIYTNTTGRNDILAAKAVSDGSDLYVYARTAAPLTSSDDSHWMLLFVDLDQDASTGWEGYELVLNRKHAGSVELWSEDGWQADGTVDFSYSGNQLELKLPSKHYDALEDGFDFKWADNPQHLDDASAFFLDGDAAPDRRFNFRY